MTRFKIGDRVKCIDISPLFLSSIYLLFLDKEIIYEVIEINTMDNIKIKNLSDGCVSALFYLPNRFLSYYENLNYIKNKLSEAFK
jgi:hypothetical protein